MVKEKSTDELIKELLEKRDHESKNQIEKFINPDYSDLKNPFDFENMEAIVNKIIYTFFRNSIICLFSTWYITVSTYSNLIKELC